MLWRALGHEPPTWAHVPVLVNDQRKKLSKRRDKVALEQYRDEGYLPEAMVNYLMTLGWAPSGDSEIVPWSRIEEEFRLEDVNHAPGGVRPQEARCVQRRVHPGASDRRLRGPLRTMASASAGIGLASPSSRR